MNCAIVFARAGEGEKIAGTMRIESIETHAVLVPLTMPTASQPLRINGREYVIVRIVDEGGASGIGYGRRLQAGSPLRP